MCSRNIYLIVRLSLSILSSLSLSLTFVGLFVCPVLIKMKLVFWFWLNAITRLLNRTRSSQWNFYMYCIVYFCAHTLCQFVIASNLLLIALQYLSVYSSKKKLNPEVGVRACVCCFSGTVKLFDVKAEEKKETMIDCQLILLIGPFDLSIYWLERMGIVSKSGQKEVKIQFTLGKMDWTDSPWIFGDVNAFWFRQHHTKPPITATTTTTLLPRSSISSIFK